MHDFGQKMDYAARMMLPAIVTLLLVILIQLPVGLAGLSNFPPHIAFISIYYWSVFHPGTMPYWFLFLLGLFLDALAGAPLGFSSLFFILFRFLILTQRRLLARETFFAAWFGFALLLFAVLLLQWVSMGLFYRSLPPYTPVAMQWCLTAGLYPLAHIFFSFLYRQLPDTGKPAGWNR